MASYDLIKVLAVGVRSGDLPVSSGKAYVYETGTTTPFATWDNNDGTGAQAHPIILDADGISESYVLATQAIAIKVTDSSDVEIWTYDPAEIDSSSTTDLVQATTTVDDNYSTVQPTLSTMLDFVAKAMNNETASATCQNLKYLPVGDTGGVGRYVYEVLRQRFDVRSFGATGDGSTPDQVNVQKAIDACDAAGGGVVYFPAGVSGGNTYLCAAALTLASTTNPISLVGDGWGTVIKQSGDDFSLIDITGTTSDVIIRDIQFQGGGSTGSTTAIGISTEANCAKIAVRNCLFTGPSDGLGFNVGIEAAAADGNATTRGTGGWVTDCYFRRIYSSGTSYGIKLDAGNDWGITGCYFSMKDDAGTQGTNGIGSSAACTDTRISNCHVSESSGAGYHVVSASRLTLTGSSARTCGTAGFYAQASNNLNISGCTFSDGTADGILLADDVSNGCDYFNISGCDVVNNARFGILLADTTGHASNPSGLTTSVSGVVTGCTCYLNGQNGIRLSGVDDMLITGCNIIENSTASIRTYPAIEVDTKLNGANHSGGSRNAFTGNRVAELAGTREHLAAIRIQQSGGGGVTNVSTTRCIGNDFPRQATNGTPLSYIYATAGRAPPHWLANKQDNVQQPVIILAAGVTLTEADSGSLVVATAAVAVVLPAVTAGTGNNCIWYDFANIDGSSTITVSRAGGSLLYGSDGAGTTVVVDQRQLVRIKHVYNGVVGAWLAQGVENGT